MTTEDNAAKNSKIHILNELMKNASDLPDEHQEWILAIAKGMAFTRSCMTKYQKTLPNGNGDPL